MGSGIVLLEEKLSERSAGHVGVGRHPISLPLNTTRLVPRSMQNKVTITFQYYTTHRVAFHL